MFSKSDLQNNVRNTHHMALKQNITMQWEKTSYEWLTPITINNFSRLLTLLFLEFQTPNFYQSNYLNARTTNKQNIL